MEISEYLSDIFHASLSAVAEKNIAISIIIAPSYESIEIKPWKPFEYKEES